MGIGKFFVVIMGDGGGNGGELRYWMEVMVVDGLSLW